MHFEQQVVWESNRRQTLCTLTSMLKFSKRRRYYQIRIDVLRRKIQESFGAFLLMWEVIFCDLHRSLAHRWFCPIFCRRKTSTSTMLWRRWILPKRSLWCVSCPPLCLCRSWAKPLTPGRTICGYFARRWGIWGILVVLVRNSWPVFPIYIYIYVCEFLLLLQFSSPQPFMTQGHLTPRPALKSLKY